MPTTQVPKKIIDTGLAGNASTGDILYDGGNKINDNMDNLYNAFGDQRMYENNKGLDLQVLHATGYYQKHTRFYYTQPIEIGSQHDIDTSSGALTILLPQSKFGEGVVFINSNGSISNETPLNIRPSSGDEFSKIQGELQVTVPNVKITVWCVEKNGNNGILDYKIESLFGESINPIELSTQIGQAKKEVQICHKNDYNVIEFIIAAKTIDGKKFKNSKIMIAVDSVANNILNNEYSVLSNDNLFNIIFKIVNNYVIAEIESINKENIRIKIKSTDAIRIGTAL